MVRCIESRGLGLGCWWMIGRTQHGKTSHTLELRELGGLSYTRAHTKPVYKSIWDRICVGTGVWNGMTDWNCDSGWPATSPKAGFVGCRFRAGLADRMFLYNSKELFLKKPDVQFCTTTNRHTPNDRKDCDKFSRVHQKTRFRIVFTSYAFVFFGEPSFAMLCMINSLHHVSMPHSHQPPAIGPTQ